MREGCRRQLRTCKLAARPFRLSDAPQFPRSLTTTRRSEGHAKLRRRCRRLPSCVAPRHGLGVLPADRLHTLCADGLRAAYDPLGRGSCIERPAKAGGTLHPVRRQGSDAHASKLCRPDRGLSAVSSRPATRCRPSTLSRQLSGSPVGAAYRRSRVTVFSAIVVLSR
jgi:hypothetical protein